MDFMNRGVRSNQSSANQSETSTGAPHGPKSGRINKNGMSLGKIGSVGFLVAVVILVAAVLLSLGTAKGNNEEQFVDKSKFQAVFLNGGQVYFGKITDLNKQYMKVDNIYYLRVNQQVQPDANTAANAQNDISLVKLGCELHGPQDKMVINREQIIFWENLKDDGQVAKAVAEYVKQNPDGQKCDASQSTSTGGSSTGTTNSTPTTPATNNSTTPATNNNSTNTTPTTNR